MAHLTRGSSPSWDETPARWLGRRAAPIEPCRQGRARICCLGIVAALASARVCRLLSVVLSIEAVDAGLPTHDAGRNARATMSWTLFIDESGQDQRHSPYEVLAGIAIEDRRVWPLIRDLSDAQQHIFGMRLFEAYGREAKAQKLLDRKTFKHAAQLDAFEHAERTQLSRANC
ncbi:DUF3800 domain-containing protein [Sphingobium rhizovicinum]|uniref:DUF3800 domain-containing protein n=1 Tax=Sphingobium rhizovicinum TaxID=432308 RepID=A0ABV7NB14_9SPHN